MKDQSKDLEEMSRDELVEKVKELREDEVVFFEPQREAVITDPDEETLSELSEIAHMETSSGDHYKFKTGEMDVWNSDLSLEEMK